MKITTIHGHAVSYNESHDRLRNAVHYLEYKLSSDETRSYFDEAKSTEYGARFEDDAHTHLKLKHGSMGYILSISGVED